MRLKSYFLLFSATMLALARSADVERSVAYQPPSFAAQATVKTELLQPNGTVGLLAAKAEAVFSISNGWWELEQVFSLPREIEGNGESYRKIPEGVRVRPFLAGSRKGILAAEALPIAFPPPEKHVALICWLALCPRPELPLLDNGHMRRLLHRNFLTHTQNRGSFTAEYLQPDSLFLSTLLIHDGGVIYSVDGRTFQYGPESEKGMLEFEYEVLSVTNVAGRAYPHHSVLRQYAFRPNPRNSGDVYVATQTHFFLNKVEPFSKHESLVPWPAQYYALDHRFPNMRTNRTVGYVVTNDHWVSVTNHEIKRLALAWNMERELPKPWRVLVALLLLALPAPLCWRHLRRSRKDKDSRSDC